MTNRGFFLMRFISSAKHSVGVVTISAILMAARVYFLFQSRSQMSTITVFLNVLQASKSNKMTLLLGFPVAMDLTFRFNRSWAAILKAWSMLIRVRDVFDSSFALLNIVGSSRRFEDRFSYLL